jgi:hypothetical protein
MYKHRANAFMLRLVGDVATTLAATLLLVGDRLGPVLPVLSSLHDCLSNRWVESPVRCRCCFLQPV